MTQQVTRIQRPGPGALDRAGGGGEPGGGKSEVRPQRQGPSEQGERPRFSIDPRGPIGRSFVS